MEESTSGAQPSQPNYYTGPPEIYYLKPLFKPCVDLLRNVSRELLRSLSIPSSEQQVESIYHVLSLCYGSESIVPIQAPQTESPCASYAVTLDPSKPPVIVIPLRLAVAGPDINSSARTQYLLKGSTYHVSLWAFAVLDRDMNTFIITVVSTATEESVALLDLSPLFNTVNGEFPDVNMWRWCSIQSLDFSMDEFEYYSSRELSQTWKSIHLAPNACKLLALKACTESNDQQQAESQQHHHSHHSSPGLSDAFLQSLIRIFHVTSRKEASCNYAMECWDQILQEPDPAAIEMIAAHLGELLSKFQPRDDLVAELVGRLLLWLLLALDRFQDRGKKLLAILAIFARRAKDPAVQKLSRKLLSTQLQPLDSPAVICAPRFGSGSDISDSLSFHLQNAGTHSHIVIPLYAEDSSNSPASLMASIRAQGTVVARNKLQVPKSQPAMGSLEVEIITVSLKDGRTLHIVDGQSELVSESQEASHLCLANTVVGICQQVIKTTPSIVVSIGNAGCLLASSLRSQGGKYSACKTMHIMYPDEYVTDKSEISAGCNKALLESHLDKVVTRNDKQFDLLDGLLHMKNSPAGESQVFNLTKHEELDSQLWIRILYSLFERVHIPILDVHSMCLNIERELDLQQINANSGSSSSSLEAPALSSNSMVKVTCILPSKRVRIKWPFLANRVQLIGSHDGWTMAVELQSMGDSSESLGSEMGTVNPRSSSQTIDLYLPTGRHFYKFIVDGKWTTDASAVTALDPSGFENNLIVVP